AGALSMDSHAFADLRSLQRLERARPLFAELSLEARHVHGLPALRRDELRQVDREAEGVVQLERLGPGDGLRALHLLEALEAALDRVEEAFFLGARDALQLGALLNELRVHAPHEPGDRMHQMHQCGFAASEQPGMADGAAENAAEHIPPSLVRRINAIRQQECYCEIGRASWRERA